MARTIGRVHVRDFHDDDLDGIVRLWENASLTGSPVYSLAEVIASCQADHAVVAVADERLVGAAVGRAAHAQGWIVFFATAQAAQSERIATALLDALERRMAPLGLGKLSILLAEHGDGLQGCLPAATRCATNCAISSGRCPFSVASWIC